MKYSIKKYTKLGSLMLFSFLTMGFVKSNIEKTKTLTETVAVDLETHFKVKNKCGPIEFRNSTGSEAKIEASLLVEGETEEEIQKVFDHFELSVVESGRIVDVVADDKVKNWVQVNTFFRNKNTITFEDGTEAIDITKMEVSLIVFLPEIKEVSIYNRYDDVKYETFNCDVDVQMFSGDLNGGDINGDLDIDLKYGDINIGNIENGDFTLFDCDSKVENAKEINLNVKYSDIEFDDIDNCTMQSFDDEIKIGNVTEKIKLDAKYSNIEFGNFKEANLGLFDSETTAKDGDELSLDSKYGSHILGDIQKLNIELFQDDIKVGVVSEVSARNTKYSEINIDKLEASFKSIASFQDNIDVRIVGEGIDLVELEGKYTDFDFPIPMDVAYHLDAQLKYCNFSYPDSCDNGSKNNGDQSYSIDCNVKGAGENSLKVKIDVFDGDIIIK